jgi:hypothetical protein
VRAIVSVPPPGENGTMMRMGRSAELLCADTNEEAPKSGASKATATIFLKRAVSVFIWIVSVVFSF